MYQADCSSVKLVQSMLQVLGVVLHVMFAMAILLACADYIMTIQQGNSRDLKYDHTLAVIVLLFDMAQHTCSKSFMQH